MSKTKRRVRYTAKTADKFVLYQKAVQSPESEVDICDRIYRKQYGQAPTLFREDFCGTALISCEWAKRRRANHAYGVDLHKPTLDYGRKHSLSQLSEEAAARVHLIEGNVRHVRRPKVHVVGAFNFSYFIFKHRNELVAYYTAVRKSLAPKGMFILDAYGGWEAQEEMTEETKHPGFTYVWDQAVYNPIDDHAVCHIHFKFPDGSKIKKAFSYDWRLWTLPELQEILTEAGFRRSTVYWQGTDEDGEGDGEFEPATLGEPDAAWIAYLVAEK